MQVWVVVRIGSDGLEIDGIYSSQDKALAACTPKLGVMQTAAVPMEVDKDYSDKTRFLVTTPANPQGVMTDRAI